MSNNTIKTRVQIKADTSTNWQTAGNNGFTPLKREPIFYSDTGQIKLGDGATNINQLHFFNKQVIISRTEPDNVKEGDIWIDTSDIPDYLCFTAQETNSTVAMSVKGTPTKGQLFEASTDGINWSTFTPGTTTITLSNVGDKVYFRGDNTTVSESSSIYYQFVMTGKIAASGNIMSLLDKTCKSVKLSNQYCYFYMFKDCASLTTAPSLPATTLASNCYRGMFGACTNLTIAPSLPATTLANYCYNNMFNGCTNLTTAPLLPATTLAPNCYNQMFFNCSSLQVYSSSGTGHEKAWRIPTSGTASSYTSQSQMFYMCPGSYTTSRSVSLNTTFYTQNIPV